MVEGVKGVHQLVIIGVIKVGRFMLFVVVKHRFICHFIEVKIHYQMWHYLYYLICCWVHHYEYHLLFYLCFINYYRLLIVFMVKIQLIILNCHVNQIKQIIFKINLGVVVITFIIIKIILMDLQNLKVFINFHLFIMWMIFQ